MCINYNTLFLEVFFSKKTIREICCKKNRFFHI